MAANFAKLPETPALTGRPLVRVRSAGCVHRTHQLPCLWLVSRPLGWPDTQRYALLWRGAGSAARYRTSYRRPACPAPTYRVGGECRWSQWIFPRAERSRQTCTIRIARQQGLAGMPDPSNTVYLVSCVSKKRSTPAPAKDLYISDWFVKARHYVEGTRSPWFILSAEYGLVPPDLIVAPYERTLKTMRAQERQSWAERVKAKMETSLPAVERIVVLAGLRYREYLMDYLRQRAKRVEVPMEGMGIGRQLHFLAEAQHHERL